MIVIVYIFCLSSYRNKLEKDFYKNVLLKELCASAKVTISVATSLCVSSRSTKTFQTLAIRYVLSRTVYWNRLLAGISRVVDAMTPVSAVPWRAFELSRATT